MWFTKSDDLKHERYIISILQYRSFRRHVLTLINEYRQTKGFTVQTRIADFVDMKIYKELVIGHQRHPAY